MRGMWIFWFFRITVVATIVLEYILSIKPFFDFGINAYTIDEIRRNPALVSGLFLNNYVDFFGSMVSMFSPFIIGFCALLLFTQVLGERTNTAMKEQNLISLGFLLMCILYLCFLFSPLGYASREWIGD